jgi:hypothetical protein
MKCKLYNYLHNDSTVIDKGIPNVYYCSTEGTHFSKFRRLQRFSHGFDGPIPGITVQPDFEKVFTEDSVDADRSNDPKNRIHPQSSLYPP